jgi:hypothetical protein
MDPAYWLEYYFMTDPTKTALHLRFVEDGFNVWFSYSRGTEYSQTHD